MSDQPATFDEVSQEILAYLKERDWDKKNSPRSLARREIKTPKERLVDEPGS